MSDEIWNTSFSEIDASNNQASPSGWPTGMFPNGVEPSARMNMAALKRHWNRINPVYLSTQSTADAYVVTPAQAILGYGLYERWRVRFNIANASSSPTVAISGFPPLAFVKYDGAGNKIALAKGDIQAQDHEFWYDGLGNALLMNPAGLSTSPALLASLTRVRFTVTSTSCTISKATNVGSVDYIGTGNYRVNFAQALADANYIATLGVSGVSGEVVVNEKPGAPRTTSNFQISVVDISGSAAVDPPAVSVMIAD